MFWSRPEAAPPCLTGCRGGHRAGHWGLALQNLLSSFQVYSLDLALSPDLVPPEARDAQETEEKGAGKGATAVSAPGQAWTLGRASTAPPTPPREPQVRRPAICGPCKFAASSFALARRCSSRPPLPAGPEPPSAVPPGSVLTSGVRPVGLTRMGALSAAERKEFPSALLGAWLDLRTELTKMH